MSERRIRIAHWSLASVLLVGCSPPEPEVGVYEDLPMQYGEIIPSETDCDQLQAIFDTAEGAGDHQRDIGNLDMARDFTRVMGAADYRMREVGCYD